MTRAEALERLRAQIDAGRPIIGAGAGTGLSAKCAEAGFAGREAGIAMTCRVPEEGARGGTMGSPART